MVKLYICFLVSSQLSELTLHFTKNSCYNISLMKIFSLGALGPTSSKKVPLHVQIASVVSRHSKKPTCNEASVYSSFELTCSIRLTGHERARIK